jgi:hypothetical protein
MFEREIKFIYDFNINKLNKLGSFFSFEQLRSTDIHPAIIQYISAELDYLIFEDRQKLVKDSIFDYSGEKVAKYFAQINEELKKSKRLSSDYAAKIILHAISFNVNFLVRPKWALAKFIYEDESHRTAAEIKQILNYLYFYKYLRKILTSYLNAKKIISLNSAEFVDLLNNIDRLSVQSDYNGVISASLKSMAEFFNIGGVQKSKVPFNAVQIFLEDKGLDAQLEKLREEFSDETAGRIEINDAAKIITSVLVKEVEQPVEMDADEEEMEIEAVPIKPVFNEEEKVGREEKEFTPPEEKDDFIPEEKDETVIEKEDDYEPVPASAEEKGIREMFEANIPEFDKKELEEEFEEDAVETAIAQNEIEEIREEAAAEMEGLIEEDDDRKNAGMEMIVEDKKEDFDDWVFVEEDEHSDIIKEIAEPEESGMLNIQSESAGEEVKKKKPGRKKQIEEEDEESLLFEGGEEKSFEEILKEEEKAYKGNTTNSGDYDESRRDFSKLIENQDMAKLIDVLFDCDIEEVELMLNSISFFSSYREAENFIDVYFAKMEIPQNSAEVAAFKEIIKENYNKGRK